MISGGARNLKGRGHQVQISSKESGVLQLLGTIFSFLLKSEVKGEGVAMAQCPLSMITLGCNRSLRQCNETEITSTREMEIELKRMNNSYFVMKETRRVLKNNSITLQE